MLQRSPERGRWWGQDPRRYPGWCWHLEPRRTAPGRWLEKEDTNCDPSGSWLELCVCALVCVQKVCLLSVFLTLHVFICPSYQHDQSTHEQKYKWQNPFAQMKQGLYTYYSIVTGIWTSYFLCLRQGRKSGTAAVVNSKFHLHLWLKVSSLFHFRYVLCCTCNHTWSLVYTFYINFFIVSRMSKDPIMKRSNLV